MPGYASWKILYQEEFRALSEEGCSVGDGKTPPARAEYLPFPEAIRGTIAEDAISEKQWEEAYRTLWKIRDKGQRPDFLYVEPDEYDSIIAAAPACPTLTKLNPRDYQFRIAGAWHGKCAAVVLGKPLEMGYSRADVKKYLESTNAYPLCDWVMQRSEALDITLREDCIPSTRGNIGYVQSDDDVHYNILALLLAEKHGPSFTKHDVGRNWIGNIPYEWFWCASRQAYYHLVNLHENESVATQLDRIPTNLNPWRECIDGQLRGDVWGYLIPGDPRLAACYAHRDCSLSLVKNGIYGGMFVAGAMSAALCKNLSVDAILDAGLSVIPVKSRLAEAVRLVRQWYRESPDWEVVCEKIEKHYGHLPFAGTMNNMAVVVLALLHGNLDFTKTITTAVMCGFDTDCTSGTAGSIAGAAVGIGGIPSRWVDPFQDTVKTVVAEFGQGSINDLVKRTVSASKKFNWI